jgi:hypothetical protein
MIEVDLAERSAAGEDDLRRRRRQRGREEGRHGDDRGLHGAPRTAAATAPR